MSTRVHAFLELAVNQGGSDLHLVSGQPPCIRIHGVLHRVRFRELSVEDVENWKLERTEKVAQALGFAGKAAEETVVATPLAGYAVPGVRSPAAATALAGALGTLVMFGFSLILGRLLARKAAAGGRAS